MKLRTRILALVMALLVAVTSPLQAFAEGEAANQAGTYLEDVYVAVAKTPDEAARVLDEKGREATASRPTSTKGQTAHSRRTRPSCWATRRRTTAPKPSPISPS